MDKKKKTKTIIKYSLIPLLFIFSFWYLFKDIHFSSLKSAMSSLDTRYLTLAIVMVFVQIFIQGLCYVIMGNGLNCHITPVTGFGYCSVDLFFSQLTPFAVGGQPMMVYEMKAKGDLPVAKTTTMVLLYSFLNKLALIILAILAAIFCWNEFFANASHGKLMVGLLIFGVCSNLFLASFSIIFMFMGGLAYKMGARIIFWLHAHHMLYDPYTKCKKLHKTIMNFKASNRYVKNHLFMSFIVLMLCILKRIATFSIAYFIYRGFGLSEHGFFYIIFAQTVYAVISDSFPIPGGIGAAETSIKQLYDDIYKNAASGVSDTAAILVRGISYYVLILVSGITTIIVMTKRRKKVKEYDLNENNGVVKEIPQDNKEEL